MTLALHTEKPDVSNYLTSGAGGFYEVCEVAGAYRVQRSDDVLPPLHMRIIDAVGTGSFSVDATDLQQLRDAQLVTLSGDPIPARPILMVPFETAWPQDVAPQPDGSLTATIEGWCDPSDTPPCLPAADFVQAGDKVLFDVGLRNMLGGPETSPAEAFAAYVASADASELQAFLHGAAGLDLATLQGLGPDIPTLVWARLVSALLFEQMLAVYDDAFDLRGKGVVVGLWQTWYADGKIADHCPPDQHVACAAIDDSLDTLEGAVVSRLKTLGHTIYLKSDVALGWDGTPRPIGGHTPHHRHFDGVFLEMAPANDHGHALDQLDAFVDALEGVAAGLPPGTPVYLSPWAGPMRFYLDGEQCEAELCPLDFNDYYTFNERMFRAALDAFDPGELQGFGAALYDTQHFDVLDPEAPIGGILTARVGETLANNPLLNIYLTR